MGLHSEDAARATYHGRPGDRAVIVDGDHDLDADGHTDILIGAYGANSSIGRVAVLSNAPDGDHVVWDVADARISGTVPVGYFGGNVSGGDLDGDGYDDVIASATLAAEFGAAHVFRGPLVQPEYDDLASDWSVQGTGEPRSLGVSAQIGDLDDDGHAELVLGAAAAPLVSGQDGAVLVFAGPVLPGALTDAGATLVLHNAQPPDTAGDGFGQFLEVGDLDCDGDDDLAVAAPFDVEDGRPVGSVSIFCGAPDLLEGP